MISVPVSLSRRAQRPPRADAITSIAAAWASARRLNIENKKVLYVGDMTIDVNCARRAAVRMVAVATGSSSKKELKELKPWAFIDKMVMLRSIIMNNAKETT